MERIKSMGQGMGQRKICSRCKIEKILYDFRKWNKSLDGRFIVCKVCVSKLELSRIKICKKCLIEKKFKDFYKDIRLRDGLLSVCKKCESEYKKNRPKINHLINQNKLCKICAKCKQEKIMDSFYNNSNSIDGKDYYCMDCHTKNREKFLSIPINMENKKEYSKKRRNNLRVEVISAYGGFCECCGENRLQFLTIEHSFGNGAEHKVKVGGSSHIYEDLKKRNFPKNEGIRILCYNCNCSKGKLGICLHNKSDFFIIEAINDFNNLLGLNI